MKQFLFAFFLFFALQSFSQNLKIIKTDGTTKSVTGKLKYNDEGFIQAILVEDNTSNHEQLLNNISSIADEDKKYIVQNYNKQNFAFEVLIENNLSLYKSKNKYFLKGEKYSFREIPYNQKDGFTFKTFNAGILGVFVNNCKESQNYIYNNFNRINIARLRDAVNSYNKCEITENIEISEQVIEESNKPNEKIEFGISIGNTFLNTNYKDILDHSENYSFINIGGTLFFRPNILNRQLFYRLTVNYMFKSEVTFFKDPNYVSLKHEYIETLLSINYLFLKEDSKINPYLGISGGLFYDNGLITLTPNLINQPPVKYSSGTQLVYTINAGMLFKILNQNLDLNISYLPNTKYGLKNTSSGEEKTNYTINGLSLRVSYIF